METIEKVEKAICCGCLACLNICPVNAIESKKTEGSLYPVIDKNKCISCGRCAAVCNCTGEMVRRHEKLPSKAYLYASRDRSILSQTTSGGFFSQLAKNVIEAGGTVFAPAFDGHWNLPFISVRSLDGIQRIRGSKYVEADPGTIFRKVEERVKQGERVLFSGTPCQVSGLKSYLHHKKICFQDNLILAAVICHGNVSSDYFKRFLDHISKGREIESINFREKTYGYSTSTLAVYFKQGASYHESYDNGYYLPAFFSGCSIRKSCFACRFRGGGKTDADFVMGDYWKPTKDNQGQTVVFAYSKYASDYMERLMESAQESLQVIPAEDAVYWNGNGKKDGSCLFISPTENKQRAEFVQDAFQMGLDEIRRKYFPVTIKKRIKNVLRPIRYRVKRRWRRDGKDETVNDINRRI